MSGYRLRINIVSKSCSCFGVKCVRCRLWRLFAVRFFSALELRLDLLPSFAFVVDVSPEVEVEAPSVEASTGASTEASGEASTSPAVCTGSELLFEGLTKLCC